MDEGVKHSRAERFVRSMQPPPDRWFYDGNHIHLIYGSEIRKMPFSGDYSGQPMNYTITRSAEGNEVWRQPTDERTALEENQTYGNEYMLAVSICPDYLVGDSIPRAMQDAMYLVQLVISEGIIEPSGISVQIDNDNNEIDLVIGNNLDFDEMSRIHDGLTEIVSDRDINAYVYASFEGALSQDFYPLKYGYPSGRQAMVGRSFAAETLVRESAVRIDPDIKSLVERVAATQNAIEQSEMQQRIMRVQYGQKNGTITSMEEVFEILSGADGFSAEDFDEFMKRIWEPHKGKYLEKGEVNDDLNDSTSRSIDHDLVQIYHDPDSKHMFAGNHSLQLIPDDQLPEVVDSLGWEVANRSSIPDDSKDLFDAWCASNDNADPQEFTLITINDIPTYAWSNVDYLSIKRWDWAEDTVHDYLYERYKIRIYDEDDGDVVDCPECGVKVFYDDEWCWGCQSFIGDDEYDAEEDDLVRFEAPRGRPKGSGKGNYACRVCGGSGHNARTCPQAPPTKQSRTPPRSRSMPRTCSTCGESGHNSRTCRHPPAPTSTKRTVICGRCGVRGHNVNTCLEPEPEVEVVDPRIVDDFEKTPRGPGTKESKMARNSRVKRNVERILANNPRGLGSHELKSIYELNTGASGRYGRAEFGIITRIAGSANSILLWRDRYYLLGDGGKEEFFKTGPGSLRG